MTAPGTAAFDDRATFPQMLAARAQWHPERAYLEDVSGRILTYADAHRAALTWAAALHRAGVEAGDRVAVLMPPSFEAALAWLGAAWLKAIEVPINTNYRGELLHYQLADSGSRVLVTVEGLLDRIPAVLEMGLPNLEAVIVMDSDSPVSLGVQTLGGGAFLDGAHPVNDQEPPQPWDLAGILYTGGTTGPSKGVMIPWGFYTAGVRVLNDLTPDDAWYAPFPMFHGIGKVALMSSAFAGGRDVIREQFQTQSFWQDVDSHGCTFTVLLPALFRWLLAQPSSEDDRRHTLKAVMGYGDLSEFKARFGVRIYTQFGMTEAGNPIMRKDAADNWASSGRVRPGYQVRVVDEHDYEVPVGEVGELLVRTDHPWMMTLGYYGKPDKTVETWRNGWVHTGDAFKRDSEGNFYFVDRVRDYMRRRGENISSFEVEAIVAKHPHVVEVAAIGVPSETGEDEVKVVVVPAPGQTVVPEELIEWLIPRMPRFMVPRYIELVSELPKTPSSQTVRKFELRQDPLNARTWDRERAGIVLPR